MDPLEINFDEAQKLANNGGEIKVLADNFWDTELVKELFGSNGKVIETDFSEARILVMNLGDPQDINDLAKAYENSVIICPHGNTSLRMAHALQNLGVKAYSLKGGLAELKSR